MLESVGSSVGLVFVGVLWGEMRQAKKHLNAPGAARRRTSFPKFDF